MQLHILFALLEIIQEKCDLTNPLDTPDISQTVEIKIAKSISHLVYYDIIFIISEKYSILFAL